MEVLMLKFGALLFTFALAATDLSAAVSVSLSAPSSTIEVGQTLTITATAKDSATTATRFSYQFTVRPHNNGPWIVMQDYYWNNTFPWTPSDHEGVYDIGVTAWSEATRNSAPTYFVVTVNPRVTGSTPILTSTANALVALYSAPACSAPAQMRVQFKSASTNPVYTAYKPCDGLTMNFYLGGVLPRTTYTVQHFLSTGAAGPQLSWSTGSIPSDVQIPNNFTISGPQPPTSVNYPFLLHATIGASTYASDVKGNVVWYRTPNQPPNAGYLMRLVPGGTFLALDSDPVNSKQACGTAPPLSCGDHQFVREYDLAGNIVRSTSWAVVNDYVNQVRALQRLPPVRFNFFSHDALRLPNGYTVILATNEQVKTLEKGGTQDVLGDTVAVLNTDLQVVWTWDAFDFLDVNRQTIGAPCTPGGAGCPAQFFNKQPNGQPYKVAVDWTHANSLFYDSSDGNLIISFRHQSWAIKVDYANGTGSGKIIWKLGYGGSFTLPGGYPVTDWFSGQHDVEVHSNGVLTLFDNNVPSTVTQQPGGNAHGQAWTLDTKDMIATPIENIDLGVVAIAGGTAQWLANGNSYAWQAGFVNNDQEQSFEYTPSGNLLFHEQSDSEAYRAFRVADLYTPTP
jgi:hypothetical protein